MSEQPKTAQPKFCPMCMSAHLYRSDNYIPTPLLAMKLMKYTKVGDPVTVRCADCCQMWVETTTDKCDLIISKERMNDG